jgi:hypothetical protein
VSTDALHTLGERPAPKEYLSIEELGEQLHLSPKTIRNKMARGVFRKGIHYFSPNGIGPRFKWSAVVAWLEGTEPAGTKKKGLIPMARGYYMDEPGSATSEDFS